MKLTSIGHGVAHHGVNIVVKPQDTLLDPGVIGSGNVGQACLVEIFDFLPELSGEGRISMIGLMR